MKFSDLYRDFIFTIKIPFGSRRKAGDMEKWRATWAMKCAECKKMRKDHVFENHIFRAEVVT